MNITKIISINILIFTISIIIIEIIFGSWFFGMNSLNHLNIIRDRVIETNVEDIYNNSTKTIMYSRDKFGLRGISSFNNPKEINILTIGGSTTDQRYIDDERTWQEILESKLRSNGIDLKVSNAGVDGQSTFGHIKNFQLWFPLVPDLSPEYIIFYIGINDFYIDYSSSFDNMEKNENIISKIKDKSAVYNLFRKIYGIITAYKYSVRHSNDNISTYKYVKDQLISFDDYEVFFGDRLVQYKARLNSLIKFSKDMGATVIFVTQPSIKYKFDENGTIFGVEKRLKLKGYEMNGIDYYYLLVEMNNVIFQVSEIKNIQVIDLTELNIWEEDDFYDSFHMTPEGTEKVGEIIANTLKQSLNK